MTTNNFEIIEKPPVQTQFQIFTLFGEYILPRGGKIWTKHLLELMQVLGMSERAVRSVLSRLTRKGWLQSSRHGRHSQYSLTDHGRALLERGARRIFEPLFTDWDEQWHIVVYSLPEEKRAERHSLRTQLAWLGFGHLAPGTWISAHNRYDEIGQLAADLDIKPYIDLFAGAYQGPVVERKLVQRCWDLDTLAEQYQEFVTRFQPEYRQCLGDNGRPHLPDAQDCFVKRYWLTHAFQAFTLQDPNLPVELLPEGWIGLTARELFDNYRQLVISYANQYVDEVMSR